MAEFDFFQGRARIWDDDGTLRLDSNHGYFPILTVRSGSRAFASRGATACVYAE
jgi:hypothetical protein